jgi:hypothetical protein
MEITIQHITRTDVHRFGMILSSNNLNITDMNA